jgi:predicted transcriptional regulator
MKKKLGTTLEEGVITELKILAAKEDKKLSWLIEEALRQYLKRKQGGVVRKTEGTLRASPQVVQAILEEDEFYAS